jgi:hypothetical protein
VKIQSKLLLSAALWLLAGAASYPVKAEPAAELSALAKMPIREITIFKDGHAFVEHSGNMPVDPHGNVLMDYLPTPVLGTFWAFSADKSAKLAAVVASQHRIRVPYTALSISELIQGNVGAQVEINELTGVGDKANVLTYEAIIDSIPERSSDELENTSPPNSGDKLPQKSNLVLLKTTSGLRAVPIDRIQNVTFKGDYQKKNSEEEFRNLLTLKLDGRHGATANVGMMYLQKGIRWIPSYKMVLDDSGNAVVKLQATLINELADLNDINANLVIGVPNFDFKDDTDPIAIQQAIAQLSPYFDRLGATGGNFSNAIMSQTASYAPGKALAETEVLPEVANSSKNEDLYVFNIKHVSLKKDSRMVLPVAEFTLPYKNFYLLDIPVSPPAELKSNGGNARSAELKNLLAPKVMHKIRLTNKSQYPLTTAPVLIMKDSQVLSQGLMTYAAAGATVDVDATTAVDIQVKKKDKETGRTANDIRMQGNQYARVDLAGNISITNFGERTAQLEITRSVYGKLKDAHNNGEIEMVNLIEDTSIDDRPNWWNWYNWPSWWNQVNGRSRVTWKLSLDAGKTIDLNYDWYYYWR